jgi:hypothetical protein
VGLCAKPSKPRDGRLLDAHSVLVRTIDSADSFFSAFTGVRKARKAAGTPTDHEQDLLRAALLFSAAGLDAMVKQLIRDALQAVQTTDAGAQQQFYEYSQQRLSRSTPVDLKLLAQALMADHPREHLRTELIRDLTGNSLQSKDQLLRVAAFFAIGVRDLNTHLGQLKTVFDARNQIAHEMDILFGQINRGRRSRSLDSMKAHTAFVLNVCCAFYNAVEKKLANPSTTVAA